MSACVNSNEQQSPGPKNKIWWMCAVRTSLPHTLESNSNSLLHFYIQLQNNCIASHCCRYCCSNTENSREHNSIQVYLYSAFHETIFAKQLYRKLSFFNRCIYCRNLIHFTYGKIWLILYILWGFGINSSQVFGLLGLFKGWIQTEACVIHSYHGMLIQKQRNK